MPGNEPEFGDGYDNTGSLDAQNWRHVQFIDRVPDEAAPDGDPSGSGDDGDGD